MQFIKIILDLIFPPRCEVCRSLGPDTFCGQCASEVSFLKPSTFVHSMGIYEGSLKKAIKRFKYNKKIHLSKPLGDMMARYIKSNIGVSAIDFFVPVPLHYKRLHQRGFNQSEILSHELSVNLSIPTVTGVLHRVKETKPQFEVSRKDRFKNVKSAFVINSPSFIENKKVALIDDIYTTGSTISECTKVLKEAGAAQVHVFTLSRAIEL